MKLGLDIGNSGVKGALLNDKNVLQTEIDFPSAIAHISDEKYLTYVREDDFYIQVLESALKHFDDIVAVGQKAVEIPGYKEFDVSTTSYKTNHPMTTAMLFGAIAANIKKDKVTLKLAVSIPIVESKSLGLANEYKSLLIGTHKIRVYEESGIREMEITVENAVVSNEGQAGFLGLLDTVDKPFINTMMTTYAALGEKGNPVETFEDFIVVDIGEGTTDISVFRNKKFNPDYSFSVTRGIGNLLEDAIATAARERLTIESRKDLQHVLESTNSRQKKRREQWEQYVKPTQKAFIDTVVDTIVKAYGNRDYFDAIIFFGGGFTALTGYDIDLDRLYMRDDTLFTELDARLETLNKTVGLTFGIPDGGLGYSRTINERGLTQILSKM